MKNLLIAAACAATLACAVPANASPIVPLAFSGSGPAVSFHGTFDASGSGSNFTVNNVAGTETYDGVTSAITGISPYAGADQLLAGAPLLPDFGGISFSTATNGDFNLYTWNGASYELSSNVDPVGYPQNGVLLSSFSVSAVPEPATWAVFFLGLGALGVALRRRKPALAAAA
jgi:hypothetical protein